MDRTQNAVAVFNKSAISYMGKFMDVGMYHDSFDIFCDAIEPKNASILDIACGPGNITRYLLDKRPDFNILGIDLAPNMLTLAAENNPGARFRLMDARDIAGIDERYDGIICGFCLPYLSKEEAMEMIDNTAKLLNMNGVLYLSTMEDNYNSSGIRKSSKGDEIYMYFHEEGYLATSLKDCGYTIIDVQRKEYFSESAGKTVDLIIIARKQ